MIMVNWAEKGTGEKRVLDAQLDDVIWNAQVPVMAGHLTMTTRAQKRIVLVIASKTVGVKLSDEAVEAVEALAEATDLPLLVLTTTHYVDDLRERFGDPDSEAEVVELGDDIVEGIADRINEHDHVIVTTMGSRDRLSSREERVPHDLLERFSGSVSILHYP